MRTLENPWNPPETPKTLEKSPSTKSRLIVIPSFKKTIKKLAASIPSPKIPAWYPKQQFFKWLFQLDDSKSLHGKWLFHQTSTLNWLEMGFQMRFFDPGFSRLGIFSEAQLVEIYNDQLRDLLAEGGRDPGRGDERSTK